MKQFQVGLANELSLTKLTVVGLQPHSHACWAHDRRCLNASSSGATEKVHDSQVRNLYSRWIQPDPTGSYWIPPDPTGTHGIPPDPSRSRRIPLEPTGFH